MIDSHLCSIMTNLATAARLIGTLSIICGMSAEIALTLQTMGLDLGDVKTALTVEEAFSILGIKPLPRKKNPLGLRIRELVGEEVLREPDKRDKLANPGVK